MVQQTKHVILDATGSKLDNLHNLHNLHHITNLETGNACVIIYALQVLEKSSLELSSGIKRQRHEHRESVSDLD